MAIGDDFKITRATGEIDVSPATSTINYSVLDFYIWIRSLGGDLASTGDDQYDINDDDIASKSYDTIINLLGITHITVAVSQRLYGGSITEADGTEWYDFKVFSPAGTYLDIIQNGAVVSNYWTTAWNADSANGISHQFLLKVSNAGVLIDNRKIIAVTREEGFDHDEFVINAATVGENVIPLSTKLDSNNQTTVAAALAFTGISFNEGYNETIDANADTVNEPYLTAIVRGANSINNLYEYAKSFVTRGAGQTLFGLSGDIFRGPTHLVNLDARTGTFAAFEAVTWSGGTGQMLGIDSLTVGTKMWIQLLTGVAPIDNQVITATVSTATATVVGSATSLTISTPWIGASTGTALTGAPGIGIVAAGVGVADKLVDLDGQDVAPPNNQPGTVTNTALNDSVLIGPKDPVADGFDEAQMTLNGALTAGAATVTVNEVIPLSGTPRTNGSIRVFDGVGMTRVSYTAISGKSFTGCTGVPNALNGAGCRISHYDGLADNSGSVQFSGIQSGADIDLWVRVRNPTLGIKTFQSKAVYGASGFTTSVIRQDD